jgi:hypothetical protein
VAGAAASWTPGERAYWGEHARRLGEAMAGLKLSLPAVFMVKTSGEEECHFAYSRNRAIVLPQPRVDIAGRDPRHDFFLLAHEMFHYLSGENPSVRNELFALLQATVPLERLLEECREPPPPAFARVLEAVLVPIDTATGEALRDERGGPIAYRVEDTDWAARVQRNSAYAIHPEELMADNFALLMEWRSSGSVPSATPSGFSVNDIRLLESVEEALVVDCAAP